MQSFGKNNFDLSSLKVGFILPAFNEYENIFILLKQIESIFANKSIIIIDDSTNDSIKNKISSREDILYVKRESRLGRGSAVLHGLKALLENKEIDFFVEIDTDLSEHPNQLPNMIRFFLDNKLDLLVASRYLEGSEIINWPLRRRLFSYLANKLAKFLLKVPVSDYTNGFRIYSNKAASHVVNSCGKVGSGFIVLSETLVQLHINNFKIRDIKTKMINRVTGKSSVNLKLVLESLFGLIKLYLNSRKKIKIAHKVKLIK
jgi:dolichol-phosphate mannosyltransferase|tara:strand:+ start:4264 stop:5043 length:780 start_codon:yes stop_codon:yes gene_type:complete